MAEWFVGRILDTLINTCSDYLPDQFGSQSTIEKELQRLRENHPKIQAVLFAAGQQAHIKDQNSALNNWIWQLRDAIDEAADLLDDFEYMKYEEQLAENEKNGEVGFINNFVSESSSKIGQVGECALKIDPNFKRLEDVVQRLDKVSAKVGTFLPLLINTKQVQQQQDLELYKARETGSLPKNVLIGRSKDKEYVLEWLKRSSNEEHQPQIPATTLHNNVSLLAIVGHGGMGKTALLQHVYEDEMTKEFDLKMWVFVSNNFDVKKVIADMLESVQKKKPNLESLDALQGSLKSEVQSKKFLLVLDDIWDEEEEKDKGKWENVLAPLAYGSSGSKILVTTRMDSTAAMITRVIKKRKETLRLKGLEEDECLQLLDTHAFVDVENPDDYKNLRSIAREMVKKLLGSPLAAKVIGGVLNSNLDERYWIRVLKSDIGSTCLFQNGILDILRLSYTSLLKPLQNCFAFCGTFPQDHVFNKDDLIRMWIALGFIEPTYIQGETIEEIGERYFNILVQKSFFDEFNNKYHYKLHDLLHELAQSIVIQEGFKTVSDIEFPFEIPETIRYLFIKTSNLEVLKKIDKLKNLRSLYLAYNGKNEDFVDVLTEIFEGSKSLRLLYLHVPHLKVIPELIGYLKHLRYLRLDECNVIQLPRSLSNLYHLQFMEIWKNTRDCLDDFLPRDINNLFNLRYLSFIGCIFPKIQGIGKLKSLQELREFFVENEPGYTIKELEHMNDLPYLTIKNLENLKDAEEACKAKLCDKRNLTKLTLAWGNFPTSPSTRYVRETNYVRGTKRNVVVPDLDERVLDNLQPHHNLKELTIERYMGVRPAIWMNKTYLICNLEKISLYNCLELQTLPPFGQLPFLKSLNLTDMPALEDLFDVATSTNDGLFPCLTALCLRNCPNLQELPYLPPKLKRLKIDNIGLKTFRYCNISKSIPLEELEVHCCPNIAYISLADVQTTLKGLRIYNCPNLIFLGGNQEVEIAKSKHQLLQNIPASQEDLGSIWGGLLPATQARNNILAEVVPFRGGRRGRGRWFFSPNETLELENLESLQCLPSSLLTISSLKRFELKCIPLLKSLPDLSHASFKCLILEHIPLQKLPDLPTSLQELRISSLNNLNCLPSCLSSLGSLQKLDIFRVPQLRELPSLPVSLQELHIFDLNNLDRLPSCLPNLYSLRDLNISRVPQLQELPYLPTSLQELRISDLNNLDCLPSCLPSLSSLEKLTIQEVPRLRELPDLPPSLGMLPKIPDSLEELDIEELKSLQCLPSSLPAISSLRYLELKNIPLLKSLPDLSHSSLKFLKLQDIPVQKLPDLPNSLQELHISDLCNLDCLPSCLPSLYSLQKLGIFKVPQLQELPDLPTSLQKLHISDLNNLDCLPSCLSSLKTLQIEKVPRLRKLPDLPPSLEMMQILNCHPELNERYKMDFDSCGRKVAHSPVPNI